MKKLVYYLFVLQLAISWWSCADFIEPDLSDSTVQLISPPDSFSTNLETVTFLWEQTEDVLKYQLQVVQPDFVTPLAFVLDSSVTDDRFVYSLAPGNYQWRVLGKNSNTSTQYQTFNLTVTQDSILTNQIVNLLSPGDNSTTNNSTVSFLWQLLSAADSYRIQCASPDFSNSTFLVFNESLSTDNYSTSLPDGEYRWRVRAENGQGESAYSEFGFSLDTQAPVAPVLVAPANATTVTSPVNLSWTFAADVVQDSVYVYSDSLATLVESDVVTSTPYSFSNGMTDSTYYWRVRSFDAGGNTSPFSDTWKFTIQ